MIIFTLLIGFSNHGFCYHNLFFRKYIYDFKKLFEAISFSNWFLISKSFILGVISSFLALKNCLSGYEHIHHPRVVIRKQCTMIILDNSNESWDIFVWFMQDYLYKKAQVVSMKKIYILPSQLLKSFSYVTMDIQNDTWQKLIPDVTLP